MIGNSYILVIFVSEATSALCEKTTHSSVQYI
jgi:hypothetical protein